MKRFKYGVSLLMVLALVALVTGCAKPPEEEKQAAKAAMDAAVAAGVDQFAAAEQDAAKKIWDAAEAQVAEKKYKEAKQGYVDAKAAFEKAAAAVAVGKKAATDEATAALASLDESWVALEADARSWKEAQGSRRTPGVGSHGLWGQPEAAKKMVAADPLGAKAKVEELKAFVDQWSAAFQALAAVPGQARQRRRPRCKGRQA